MNDLNQGRTGSSKKKILVYCDFYLPSIKSGGGMWTVVNLVDRFCDRYDFYVVTRNYDSKGDTAPYSTVKTGEWNQVGNARVFYVASPRLTIKQCSDLANEVLPDCVFLNSAFSAPVVRFLVARRRKMTLDLPVILAPCGELTEGGLRNKALKKKAFLRFARIFRLFDGVIWKASSDLEAQEISHVIGTGAELMVAPDLTPKTIMPDFDAAKKPRKEPGTARFIFLSRLVRKKNLRYLLDILRSITDASVELEIVGPLEDQEYWSECQEVIKTLPPNIRITVVGPVSYPQALELLFASHFFVLPTLNENFGYVFIESMATGCPLLTSDQVAWESIDKRNIGWRIALDNPAEWVERIRFCLQMNDADFKVRSVAARAFAIEWLARPELEQATAKVLDRALNTSVEKQV